MPLLIGNAVVNAARDFGEYPSSFGIEYSQFSDSSGQTVREVTLYRRGIDPLALVGQLLIVLAAPTLLAADMLVSSQLAIILSLLVLVTGICMRLLHRRIGRKPGVSRTVFVSSHPPLTAE